MKIIISPLAEIDIEQIGDYIAQDNPRRALSYTIFNSVKYIEIN